MFSKRYDFHLCLREIDIEEYIWIFLSLFIQIMHLRMIVHLSLFYNHQNTFCTPVTHYLYSSSMPDIYN